MELGGGEHSDEKSGAVRLVGQREPGSRYRDALRLLFILAEGSDPSDRGAE